MFLFSFFTFKDISFKQNFFNKLYFVSWSWISSFSYLSNKTNKKAVLWCGIRLEKSKNFEGRRTQIQSKKVLIHIHMKWLLNKCLLFILCFHRLVNIILHSTMMSGFALNFFRLLMMKIVKYCLWIVETKPLLQKMKWKIYNQNF